MSKHIGLVSYTLHHLQWNLEIQKTEHKVLSLRILSVFYTDHRHRFWERWHQKEQDAMLSQRWPRDVPYIWNGCPEIFQESLATPTATFLEIVNWLLLQSIVWKCLQNLKFISSHAWDKIWTIPGYANAPFSPKFLIGYCWTDTANIPAKFEVRIFTRSWDNGDWSFGRGCKPQTSGTEGCRGSGVEPFERTLVSSYRHCIVDFPLRVSETGYWRFWILMHQRYRRTDTRMTCNRKTALCSIDSVVHRAVKQRQNTSIADIIGIEDNVS